LRILQLNTVCGAKSTGRIAWEIAKLVEKDGGECYIACGAGYVPEDAKAFAYHTIKPIKRKAYSLIRKLFDAEGYFNISGTKELIRQIEIFEPDVIHIHNLHGCYLHLKTLFGYLAKKDIPVVWTLHDCWPFTGHCAYFDYSGCEKWKTGCHDCPQLKSYPECVGVDGSRRNYQLKKELFLGLKNLTMVAPCQWMKEPLSQSFLKNVPVRVIYNGVDLNGFTPTPGDLRQRYGLENSKVAVAVASDWDERKGLRFLLEAAQKLGDEYRFVVIGLSHEQVEKLPGGMIGIEHTANVEELAQWYTTADCLVNPSLEDNMPMVNLEALACGTPIAMFRTGGCPEAVDERTGAVVEKGDVDGLCRAIRSLCPKTDATKQACLARARSFDAKLTFEQYLALYKELCTEP